MHFRPICTGLADRLAGDDPGRHLLHRRRAGCVDRALAVHRVAERIDHPPEQFAADRHFEDAAGAPGRHPFGEGEVVAQDDRAHRVALQVERHAVEGARKLEHLAILGIGQPVNPHDAVGYADQGAFVAGLGAHVEAVDAMTDDIADFRWVQLLHVLTS